MELSSCVSPLQTVRLPAFPASIWKDHCSPEKADFEMTKDLFHDFHQELQDINVPVSFPGLSDAKWARGCSLGGKKDSHIVKATHSETATGNGVGIFPSQQPELSPSEALVRSKVWALPQRAHSWVPFCPASVTSDSQRGCGHTSQAAQTHGADAI